MKAQATAYSDHPSWEEAALNVAIPDLARLRDVEISTPAGELARRRRRADLAGVVVRLIDLLPPDRQKWYREKAAEVLPRALPSGRNLFNNVVELLARSGVREWTPTDVQKALLERDEEAEPKAVMNVLGYLHNAGKITRVARGRYMVSGALLLSSYDIPGTDFGHPRELED